MYLILPCLGDEDKFMEYKIKHTINSTFGAVNFRISHFTRKSYGIFKDVTSDPETNNDIIYMLCVTVTVYTSGELLRDSI